MTELFVGSLVFGLTAGAALMVILSHVINDTMGLILLGAMIGGPFYVGLVYELMKIGHK